MSKLDELYPIELTHEPDFMLFNVKCPYCKKATLGVTSFSAGRNGKSTRYQFQCVNETCVTNMCFPIGSTVEFQVIEALARTEEEYDEIKRRKIKETFGFVKGESVAKTARKKKSK